MDTFCFPNSTEAIKFFKKAQSRPNVELVQFWYLQDNNQEKLIETWSEK